jgi:hypothetical protein
MQNKQADDMIAKLLKFCCGLLWVFSCQAIAGQYGKPPVFLADMEVAKYSADNGWSAVGNPIQNMPTIYSILNNGQYAYAIGLNHNPMVVAFYNGDHWLPAAGIAGMSGIASIIPLNPERAKPQVFALSGDGRVAYFDGDQWQSPVRVADFHQIAIEASQGSAWAIDWNQRAISQFDANKQAWGPVLSIAGKISAPHMITAIAGRVYVLGLDAAGKTVLLRGDNGGHWQSLAVPNDQRYYSWQIGGNQQVLWALYSGDAGNEFMVSHDQGDSWQVTHVPYVQILGEKTHVIWARSDDQHLAYLNFNDPAANWHAVVLPSNMPEITLLSHLAYSDGHLLCALSDSVTEVVGCYSVDQQQWLPIPSINQLAERIDGLEVSNGQVLAFGYDKQQQAVAYNYLNGAWHVQRIQGLTGVIMNFSRSTGYYQPNMKVWLIGQNSH